MAKERLLGRMETGVVGRQYYRGEVDVGDRILLEREPENAHDGNAIRVESPDFEKVGHLSRRVASWMAPLLDQGAIRVDGKVVDEATERHIPLPVELQVFLTTKGRRELKIKSHPSTPEEALHEVVRRAWEMAKGWADPDLAVDMKERLWRATRGGCLPATRMLLMLLPWRCEQDKEDAAARAAAWLERIRLGSPRHHGSLTVFPLYGRSTGSQAPGFHVLEEALASGSFEVTEVHDSGEVPRLAVKNHSHMPVLAPEGSILVGAKQNRVLDVTVLVAAGSEVVVPVSCVEQGRWSYRSQSFSVEGFAHPTLRGIKEASRRHSNHERTDQGAVWAEVSACLDDVGASSQTDDLTHGLQSLEERSAEYRKRIRLSKRTLGTLVASGDRVLGLDLFGHPHICHKLWPRIQDGYVLETARSAEQTDATPSAAAQVFLDKLKVKVLSQSDHQMPGLGTRLAVAGTDIVGAGLSHQGEVVHLTAFPA